MKPDYLFLDDGSKVRVAWNMNALAQFTAVTGKGIADMGSAATDMGMLRTIAWCSTVEGEYIEGREFLLSEIEFGRLMGMQAIGKFSEIFTEQILRGTQKKTETKGRDPKVIVRKS